MTAEEEQEVLRRLLEDEEEYVRRFPVRWRRFVRLLCLLPGCLGLAADLTAWLERRYPSARVGGPSRNDRPHSQG